jgi:DNA-directed RNA polymerase specialized sigma24 family protein
MTTNTTTDPNRALWEAQARGEQTAWESRARGGLPGGGRSARPAGRAVQETYLRGWRAWDGFEKRSSERTWLHRIATNVCLNAIRDRGRRALPSGIGAPAEEVGGPSEVLPPETWVQPIASDRGDLRLALIAGLQTLSANQRAVLLLRDVLAFPAADVAARLRRPRAGAKVPAPRRPGLTEDLSSSASVRGHRDRALARR